jgi:nucleoside-diphosphate-sugar epimerase
VRGVDLKYNEYGNGNSDEFVIGDLTDPVICRQVVAGGFDELYQLAADMGGAGYIFTGENDAAVMHNSALINLHVCENAIRFKAKKVFYSSSAFLSCSKRFLRSSVF